MPKRPKPKSKTVGPKRWGRGLLLPLLCAVLLLASVWLSYALAGGINSFFEGILSAEPWPTEIGDHDGDGIPDLMVKFDRSAVQALLEPGEEVNLTITGRARPA